MEHVQGLSKASHPHESPRDADGGQAQLLSPFPGTLVSGEVGAQGGHYAHMCTHTHAQAHTHTHTCSHSHMLTRSHTHSSTHIHTQAYPHTCSQTHLLTNSHMLTHVHTFTHMLTRAHTFTHTLTHAHTHKFCSCRVPSSPPPSGSWATLPSLGTAAWALGPSALSPSPGVQLGIQLVVNRLSLHMSAASFLPWAQLLTL